MVSKLAEQTLNKWWSEGLKPTLQDITDINAVGVQLENNSESSSFYCVPRIGFLDDFCFFEPTIEKRLYIDEIMQIVDDDIQTQIYTLCYCLYTPIDELVSLKNKKIITKTIARFVKDVLSKFTESQILAMIDYVMTGNDVNTVSGDYDDKKETKSPSDIPNKCRSYTRKLLNEAIAQGIDAVSCDDVTIEQLEKIIFLSCLKNGTESLKEKNCELTGRYYQVSGKIYTRLKKEKAEREEKENN